MSETVPAPANPESNSGSGPYRLTPVPSEHVPRSLDLILQAAVTVPGGRAVVLGAGECAEIPLKALAIRFDEVLLVDTNEQLLQKAIADAELDETQRAKVQVRVQDLTGTTRLLLDKVETALGEATDAESAIEATSALLAHQPIVGLLPPDGKDNAVLPGKFNLVVASCVLSQLHIELLLQAGEAFERRFPGQREQLQTDDRWRAALTGIARRMETRFIDDLAALTAEGGLIYLSESVQMCYITLMTDGQWETPGTYRLLRTADLTDYTDRRFARMGHGRWQWIVAQPTEIGKTGQLFDVQSLVLRVWRT